MKELAQQKAIGFRVEKDAVCWSVVMGTKGSPTLSAYRKISAPVIYKDDEAARIHWFRGQIMDILSEYEPTAAMIRYPETSTHGPATNSTRERSRIEGVILQLLYEKGIKVLTGPLNTIASEISVASKSIKKEIQTENFRGLDWSKLNPLLRESTIAAIAALEK
jgi:hypothetical protein